MLWRATGTFAGPGTFSGLDPNGARIDVEGCDVVEVAPAYDSHGQPTALLGATIAWETISLHARARAAVPEARA